MRDSEAPEHVLKVLASWCQSWPHPWQPPVPRVITYVLTDMRRADARHPHVVITMGWATPWGAGRLSGHCCSNHHSRSLHGGATQPLTTRHSGSMWCHRQRVPK